MTVSLVAIVLGLALAAPACSGGEEPLQGTESDETEDQLAAAVASYDIAVGGPQRFLVGVFDAEEGNVGYGTVRMRFRPLRNSQGDDKGRWTSVVTAQFLPLPGSAPRQPPHSPVLLEGEERGVYAATVAFDRPGFWEAEVTASLAGVGEQSATAAFEVLPHHQVPAVGDAALASRNLTLDSPGVPRSAIDSRSHDGKPVPDPDLHRTTIAAALADRRPAVVVFSTPTFCLSRFCGPVTDMVAELAGMYGDRASFIHVEVWKDFEARRLNDAAAEWLTRDGAEGNEPWVFLIGSDGRITARWDNVATRGEIEPLLQQLPVIGRAP